MKLTKEQRSELLEGKFPRLTFPGDKPCPVEVNERYWISSLRHLVVTKIRRSRKGDWVILYMIYRQAQPLFVAASPPQALTSKDRERFTEAQAKGYTHSRSRALDPDEAVHWDEVANLRQSREAKERYQSERLEEVEKVLAAMTELRAAINAMPAKNRQGRSFWILRSRLDAAERDLRRRIAA